MIPTKVEFTFCDDVRIEERGKFSLMGVLRGYMHIGSPEGRVPLLTCNVVIHCDRSLIGKALNYQMFVSGNLVIGGVGAIEGKREDPLAVRAGQPDSNWSSASLQLASFQFKDGDTVTARLVIDDVVFESEPLKVLVN